MSTRVVNLYFWGNHPDLQYQVPAEAEIEIGPRTILIRLKSCRRSGAEEAEDDLLIEETPDPVFFKIPADQIIGCEFHGHRRIRLGDLTSKEIYLTVLRIKDENNVYPDGHKLMFVHERDYQPRLLEKLVRKLLRSASS